MSESKELSILPPALSPAVVFAPGGVEDILKQIREKVAGVTKDISTPAARAEIKSAAYNIARSKTALDEMGKELVAELKAKTGAIDSERKKIRDELDALKDQVRKPLTDWEEAEKNRVAAHETAIEEVRVLSLLDTTNATVSDIDAQLAKLESYAARNWEEFKTRFDGHYEHNKEMLEGFRAAIVKREEERAELERLRKEQEAREKAEREARIAAEAAEKARKEAEAKAAREAAEAAERAAAEQKRLEQEAAAKLAAEQAERERAEREKREAVERAAKAEADAKAAAEKAERDRKEAERLSAQREKEAAERAEREKQDAIEAERKRVAELQAKEKAEAEAREKDKKHKAKINNAALLEMVSAISGVHSGNRDEAEAICKAIITAIARGDVPNVKIIY